VREAVGLPNVLLLPGYRCCVLMLVVTLLRGKVVVENGTFYRALQDGLLFPTDDKTAKAAPERSPLRLIYVQSRGNRDSRPVYALSDLEAMGYVVCIDAQLLLLVSFKAAMAALQEMNETGVYSGLAQDDTIALRQQTEGMIGLEDHYAIEEETVEAKKWGKR